MTPGPFNEHTIFYFVTLKKSLEQLYLVLFINFFAQFMKEAG